MERSEVTQWVAAVAVITEVAALITLDIADHSLNHWFAGHSLTTDLLSTLLGLSMAGLVVDRVAARRRQRDQSLVIGAQAAILSAQALHAKSTVADSLAGATERDAASAELRTFLTLLLVSTPVLMDAPAPRHFLETCQRLAAELTQALALTRSGEHPAGIDDRVNATAAQVASAAAPLLRALSLDQLEVVRRVTDQPEPSEPPSSAKPLDPTAA